MDGDAVDEVALVDEEPVVDELLDLVELVLTGPLEVVDPVLARPLEVDEANAEDVVRAAPSPLGIPDG